MDKLKDFLHDVKKEIDRVRWPNRKNLIKYSGAVLFLCFLFGIFFYVINVIVVLLKDVLG